MKSNLIIVFLLFFLRSSFVFAQSSEGKVDYAVSYPNSGLPKESISMLPTQTQVWFKGEKSRFDMKMGLGISMNTIIDQNTITILMDVMGNKTAIKKDISEENGDKSTLKSLKISYESDTKELAGYLCKKAVVNTNDGDLIIWYTPNITGNNKWNDSFNGINGFPLEFNMKTGQLEMHLIAEKVVLEKVNDTIFSIPSDFNYLSEEETKAMLEGLK